MISHSISEVFQRDNKVIIPDFGAFFRSEFSGIVDFNAFLTFDDGKVIAEIQKQQNISEEDSQNNLEEFVRSVTNTIDQGMSHYFEGIGCLSKNPEGSFFIDTTASFKGFDPKKRENKLKKKETLEDQNSTKNNILKSDIAANEQPNLEKAEKKIASVQHKATSEIKSADDQNALKNLSSKNKHTKVERVRSRRSMIIEDERIREYYKRKEEYFNHTKKRKPVLKSLFVILPILLCSIAAYFYFNYFSLQDVQNNDELKLSGTLSTSEEIAEEHDEEREPNVIVNVSQSSQPSPTVDSHANDNSKSQGLTYSLIVGSFKDEDNADNLRQRLLDKGIEMDKFSLKNNYFYVGIERIVGKNNALNMLSKIKQEETGAWITKNTF